MRPASGAGADSAVGVILHRIEGADVRHVEQGPQVYLGMRPASGAGADSAVGVILHRIEGADAKRMCCREAASGGHA
jgi:hypothetical protein